MKTFLIIRTFLKNFMKLKREHIPITTFTFRIFQLSCPIHKIIVDNLPLDEDFKIAYAAYEEAIQPNNLREAIEYEFNQLKSIRETGYKLCEEVGVNEFSEYSLFKKYKVDFKEQRGLAYLLKRETPIIKGSFKNNSFTELMNTQEYFHKVCLKDIEDDDVKNTRTRITRVSLKEDLLPYYRSIQDGRNALYLYKLDRYFYFDVNINEELIDEVFSQEYAYAMTRPFEFVLDPIIAKEWVITYLNKLIE